MTNYSLTPVHHNCLTFRKIAALKGTGDIFLKITPYIILIVSIISVNTMYLFATWKTKETRKKSSKLFFTMSLSDLLVGAVAIPCGMAFAWAVTSDGVCAFLQIVKYIPTLGSCSLTIAIALDRYLIIVYEVHLQLKYLSLVVVTCVIFFIVPDMLNFFLHKSSRKYFDATAPIYVTLVLGFSLVILIPILYCHLLVIVKRNSRKSQSLSGQSQYGNKVMKTILLVLFSQYSWYFVHLVLRFYLTIFARTDISNSVVTAIAYMMDMSMSMNSVTSTVILIWRNNTIRLYLYQTWNSKIHSETPGNGGTACPASQPKV